MDYSKFDSFLEESGVEFEAANELWESFALLPLLIEPAL
jgi:hypothetical protein